MSKGSILIVEDEAIIAYDLASKLEQLGYEVTAITATGEDAVQLARQYRPALVLMDIQLAGTMNGVMAAQQIYQECRLPILFATANYDICTQEGSPPAGAVGCIGKPFDKDEIRLQIEKVLAGSPMNLSD